MFKSTFILMMVLTVLSSCTYGKVPRGAETTVILLRHADRAAEVLNSKGIARANALPSALASYDIDAIYSPDLKRNLQTAAPLSKATGIPVTTLADEFAAARMPRNFPTGTVVWVGNKGNLKSIWDSYRATGVAPLEYGDIGIIELHKGRAAKVVRLRFEPVVD
ncbi:MAG: histidine phosphatase family protein [Paracoccaceae bacterium]